MSRKCYLIFGVKTSGKDTFGNFLIKALVANHQAVQHYAFAKPLKEVAVHLLGMPWQIAEGGETERRAWEKYGRDAREWLQWIGTELGRDMIHKDIWVHRAIDRVNGSTDHFVITDGRFENELYLTKNAMECEVIPIRIRRKSLVFNDDHRSETEQLEIKDWEFKYVVENNGTLEDLKVKAADIVKETLTV